MTADCMSFPETWEEFTEYYSFKDKEEKYTNGNMLIQVFRVEQMIEHYFQDDDTCVLTYDKDKDTFVCSNCGELDWHVCCGYRDYPNYCIRCGKKVRQVECDKKIVSRL